MKDLAYYKRLPYTRRVRVEDDDSGPYFVAFVEELRGVEADGASALEALSNLTDAFQDYIQAMLGWGDEIPEPIPWPGPDYDPGAVVRHPTRASGQGDVDHFSDSTAEEKEREFEFA